MSHTTEVLFSSFEVGQMKWRSMKYTAGNKTAGLYLNSVNQTLLPSHAIGDQKTDGPLWEAHTGHGHTDVSLNTLVELSPWRMWM